MGVRPERIPASLLDRLMYVVRPLHDGQIHCVLRFEGRLDPDRLGRAARLTLAAEPVLGCRFVPDYWRPHWERLVDIAPDDVFQLSQSPEPESALSEFMAWRPDPCDGPQLRVLLLRGSQDTLCVKLSHLVADGRGATDAAAVLAGIYRALAADADYTPTANACPRPSHRDVFRGAGWGTVLRSLKRGYPTESGCGMPVRGECHDGGAFASRTVSPDRVGRLREYARSRDASFTELLATAFYRALFATIGVEDHERVPIQLTADFRRYLPEGRACSVSLLAGAFFPSIVADGQAPFDRTLGEVRAVISRGAAEHAWLAQAVWLEVAALPPFGLASRIYRRRAERGRLPDKLHAFSNIGVIDPSPLDFGTPSLAALAMYGPVTYPPGYLLSLNTFRGTLHATTSYCPQATDPALAEEILDVFIRELPA